MGKLLWHTMMSLDGFIAGPNDDMSWAFEVDAGSSETVDRVVSSTGALLVGRRTQDVEDRLQRGFYGGAYRGPFFVLRHDPPPDPPVVKGVTGRFLDLDIEAAVRSQPYRGLAVERVELERVPRTHGTMYRGVGVK